MRNSKIGVILAVNYIDICRFPDCNNEAIKYNHCLSHNKTITSLNYITTKGNLCRICYSTYYTYNLLCTHCYKENNVDEYLNISKKKKEITIYKWLLEQYPNENIIYNKNLHDINSAPDFLIYREPNSVLIIECNENQHKRYDKIKEQIRLDKIKNKFKLNKLYYDEI